MSGTNVGGIYYTTTIDTQGLINAQREINSRIGAISSKFSEITSAIGIMSAALALVEFAKTADHVRTLGARIDIAAGSAEDGADAMRRLYDISRKTETSFEGNVEVFSRLNQSMLQLGGTQQDTINLSELLAKSIKVSGASAGEAKAAMLQFGQALGSGKLQGDELRSLLETAPYLMKQLADGIGVPVSALRKMGEQGKLTSDVVTNGLAKSASKIDADFSKLPTTFEAASTSAGDALRKMAEAMDGVGGVSSALTGIMRGAGKAFDMFAAAIIGAGNTADAESKKKTVETWANATSVALSYVADAANFVSRGFEQMGTLLGGLAAGAEQLVRGNLSGARDVMSGLLGDIEAINARPLIGQQMRKDLQDMQGGGLGRGLGNIEGPTFSKLKPQTDKDEEAKKAAKNFEYLAGLRAKATQDALKQIDFQEQSELAKNSELARKKEITEKTSAEARNLIHAKYASERLAISEKEIQDEASARISMTLDESARVLAIREEAIRKADAAEKAGTATAAQAARERVLARFVADQQIAAIADKQAADRAEAAIALAGTEVQRIELVRTEALRKVAEAERRGDIDAEQAAGRRAIANRTADDQILASRERIGQQRQQAQTQTLQLRSETEGPAASGAKEELIRQQAAAQQVAVDEARRLDLENAQVYADQKVAIEQKMQADILAARQSAAAAQMAGAASLFDSLTSIAKNAAGEQSGIYKAMFVASKAFAIAESIVKIQQGIASAAALPFPANIPAMATVAAATAGIVQTISSTNFGGGRQYGGPVSADSYYRVNETGRPEMFTAANGSQYMLPTKGGSITPASDVGAGGVQWRIIINNNAAGATASASVDDSSRTVTIAVNEVASQISERRGPVWGAMRTTSVQGRPA